MKEYWILKKMSEKNLESIAEDESKIKNNFLSRVRNKAYGLLLGGLLSIGSGGCEAEDFDDCTTKSCCYEVYDDCKRDCTGSDRNQCLGYCNSMLNSCVYRVSQN